MTSRQGEDGFTLIEVMISLVLFALIAVAGFTLVDGILGVQGRTEKRLDRLADIQRALFVVTSDLEQVTRGPIAGGGAEARFNRVAPGVGGAPVEIRYQVAGGVLVRQVGPVPQPLLTGVQGARWRFFDGEWSDSWPISDQMRERWPRAVEVELELAGGPGGTLRRVVALPAQAAEPAP